MRRRGVMSEHLRGELRVVLPNTRNAVEGDGFGNPVTLLRGELEHESTTHAEAGGRYLVTGHRWVVEEEVDGAGEILGSLVDG